MTLIEELRSIAKSVEFQLGAGKSAEGRAADRIEQLRAAGQRVYDHLNDRIDHAVIAREPVPVFDGIADLHDALNATKD